MILKLEDIRKEYKLAFKHNENMSIADLDDFIDGRKQFDFDVYLSDYGINLQRDFCWTTQQKRELIMSVLKGLPIPPYAFIKKETVSDDGSNTVYQVIDGKQRLGALIDFAKNKFCIKWGEKCYYYRDLDDAAKKLIYGYEIRGSIARDTHIVCTDTDNYNYIYQLMKKDHITDEQRILWFKLLNFAGTEMDVNHMQKLESLQKECNT